MACCAASVTIGSREFGPHSPVRVIRYRADARYEGDSIYARVVLPDA